MMMMMHVSTMENRPVVDFEQILWWVLTLNVKISNDHANDDASDDDNLDA